MRHSLIVTVLQTKANPLASPAAVLPWAAAVVGIAAQIAYPLSSGSTLDAVTVVSVAAFFVAVTVALARAGGLAPVLLATAFVLSAGWAVEALGVHTGIPFGRYEYTSALGGSLASVPLIVPFAWAGMAPVAVLVGRRLGHPVLGGAALLTTWDLFLDPQMVAAGRWHWLDASPALPGIPGVPLTNYLGWLVVSALLVAALHRMLPPARSGVIDLVLYWTYASQVLAAAAFFGRPMVALIGGVAMGCLVVPYRRRAFS